MRKAQRKAQKTLVKAAGLGFTISCSQLKMKK
jgi:hypothetical protein